MKSIHRCTYITPRIQLGDDSATRKFSRTRTSALEDLMAFAETMPPCGDVLQVLAAIEQCSSDALWIDDGIVWRAARDGTLRTVCAIGTPYWRAALTTAEAITKAKAPTSR